MERLHPAGRLGHMFIEVETELPVLAERGEGLGRQGVDGAGTDQGLDVVHVGEAGVLRPGQAQSGRCGYAPRAESWCQRGRSSDCRNRSYAAAALAMATDRELAGEYAAGVRGALEHRVELTIEPAHEEARHAAGCTLRRCGGRNKKRLHAGHEGVDDLDIPLDGEQERHIDVDAHRQAHGAIAGRPSASPES